MGEFEDLDLQTAQDDPWSVPDNTYLCTITESSVNKTAAGDKTGWGIKYTIVEGEHAGSNISEWKQMTPKTEKSRSFVRQRMLSLGVPDSRMNEVKSAEFVGMENLLVKVKKGKVFSVEKAPEGFVYNGDGSGLNEFEGTGNPLSM